MASNTRLGERGTRGGFGLQPVDQQKDVQNDGVEAAVQRVGDTERGVEEGIARGGDGGAVELEGGSFVLVSSGQKTGQACLFDRLLGRSRWRCPPRPAGCMMIDTAGATVTRTYR